VRSRRSVRMQAFHMLPRIGNPRAIAIATGFTRGICAEWKWSGTHNERNSRTQ
jgi:hypothetical protein